MQVSSALLQSQLSFSYSATLPPYNTLLLTLPESLFAFLMSQAHLQRLACNLCLSFLVEPHQLPYYENTSSGS